MKVPLLDLTRVQACEEAVAEYSDCAQGVGVSSGTDALSTSDSVRSSCVRRAVELLICWRFISSLRRW